MECVCHMTAKGANWMYCTKCGVGLKISNNMQEILN